METFVQSAIYFHAFTGMIALVSGTAVILFKKGSALHKKIGKVFYLTMTLSALSSILIAWLPNHQNLFLFSIGVFTLYMLITGYSALRFKQNPHPTRLDYLNAITMLSFGIGMVFGPLFFYGKLHPVGGVLGLGGTLFAVRDILLYRSPERLKKGWLKLHVGKTVGSFISAVTAFVVVNQYIPGLWGWFAPGTIGGLYITYWMFRLNRRPSSF